MDISNNLLHQLPFLAILAPVILFFNQSKNFLLKIFRIFWKEREIPVDYHIDFYKYLYDNSIIVGFDDYKIKIESFYSIEHKRRIHIPFKLFKMEIFLYKNFIPVFVYAQSFGVKIQYFKFTLNFEKIIENISKTIIKDILNKKRHTFWIEEKVGLSIKQLELERQKPNYIGGETKSAPAPSNDFTIYPHSLVQFKINRLFNFDINSISDSDKFGNKDKYIFTETGQYLLNQVQRWLQAENFYKEKNINWRRGFLLNGKPGNGKSSLVLQIAKKSELPLYIFQLSTMDNNELKKFINDLGNGPGIILIEDFDNIFNLRQGLIKGGVTFDFFINIIGGANSLKDKILFITTNHLDKVDPAVLRPGRCDEIIDVKPLNENERLDMANIILDNNSELVREAMRDSESLSTASFENKVVQIALSNYWNKK